MKKMVFLMAILLMQPTGWTRAEQAITVMIDGQTISFPDGAEPYLDENERTMVAVNEITLALGATKTWNDNEKSVIFLKENDKIEFTIGSEKYSLNTTACAMDTSAVLVGDKMFVPIRYLAQGFGLTVTWDMQRQLVSLQTSSPSTAAEKFQFEQKLLETFSEHNNTIMSPVGLSIAMSMVANGVTGETQQEILHVFGITDLPAQNKQMQTVLQAKEHTMQFANAMWINQGYYPGWSVDFSSAFKNIINKSYGGAARAIPEQNGADTINQWICEHTDGQIKQVLQQSQWEEFLSVIVNTLSFRDAWAIPFDTRLTTKEPFYAFDGEIQKDFMAQTAHLPYFEDALCQAVALPYKHGDISLILILPQTQEKPILQHVVQGLQTRNVFVKLPKFEVKSQSDTTALFQKLGIKKAFEDNNPDFAEMYVNLPLTAKIKAIIQNTSIIVDENGTQAAAATLVGGAGGGAMAEPPIQFVVNRPFYFMLYDKKLETAILLGQYLQ